MKRLIIWSRLFFIFTILINVWVEILFWPTIVRAQFILSPLQHDNQSTDSNRVELVSAIATSLLQMPLDSIHLQRLPLSVNEIRHLSDVHQLLIYHQIFCVVSVLGIVFWNATTRHIRTNQQDLLIFFSFLVFFLCALTVSIMLWWDQFFTTFHELLFPQGNWSFPASSVLIQLFPDSFWQMMFAEVFFLATISTIFIYSLPTHDKISECLPLPHHV